MRTDTELIKPGLDEVLLRFFTASPTGESGYYRLPNGYGFFTKQSDGDLVCDFGSLEWKDVGGYHHLFEKLEVCLKAHNLIDGEVVVKSRQYMR